MGHEALVGGEDMGCTFWCLVSGVWCLVDGVAAFEAV